MHSPFLMLPVMLLASYDMKNGIFNVMEAITTLTFMLLDPLSFATDEVHLDLLSKLLFLYILLTYHVYYLTDYILFYFGYNLYDACVFLKLFFLVS